MSSSSYSSSRSSSSSEGRYRTTGYPPPANMPPFLGYSTAGSHHSQYQSSQLGSPQSNSHHHSHPHSTKDVKMPASIMSDGHSEAGETPTRKRIAVACGRCRKRKIRCSGDPGGGLPCANCKQYGAEPCQFLRVSSTLTPIRHEDSSSSSAAHLNCGYNIEVSRAAATHRGSMPPLPMPSYADDIAHPTSDMMSTASYQPRGSYSGYASSRAGATTPYYSWSGAASTGYAADEDYPPTTAPYYPVVPDYSSWSGAAGSSTGSRSRSGTGSAAGSMYVDPKPPQTASTNTTRPPTPTPPYVPVPVPVVGNVALAHRPALVAVSVATVSAVHAGSFPIPYTYSHDPAVAQGVFVSQPTAIRPVPPRFVADGLPEDLPRERVSTLSPSSSPEPVEKPRADSDVASSTSHAAKDESDVPAGDDDDGSAAHSLKQHSPVATRAATPVYSQANHAAIYSSSVRGYSQQGAGAGVTDIGYEYSDQYGGGGGSSRRSSSVNGNMSNGQAYVPLPTPGLANPHVHSSGYGYHAQQYSHQGYHSQHAGEHGHHSSVGDGHRSSVSRR